MRRQSLGVFVGDHEFAVSYGRLDAPDGHHRPLVVVEPGLPLQRRSYGAMVADVAAQGFSVVVPDRLPFSVTAPLGSHLVARVAQVKSAFLRQLYDLHGHGFVLVGHSLGAAIDAATAATAPELVDSLLQINPWGFPQRWRPHQYALVPTLANVSLRAPLALARTAVDASLNLGGDPVSHARMLLAAAQLDNRPALVAARGIPATVVVGDRDVMVRGTVDAYCDALGAGRRVVLPGENHLLGVHYPPDLRAIVGRVLDEALQRSAGHHPVVRAMWAVPESRRSPRPRRPNATVTTAASRRASPH